MSKILIKIQKNRQITIPERIRRAFGIKVGDVLEFKATDEGIVLIPQKSINKPKDKNCFFQTVENIREQTKDIAQKEIDQAISGAVKAARKARTKNGKN